MVLILPQNIWRMSEISWGGRRRRMSSPCPCRATAQVKAGHCTPGVHCGVWEKASLKGWERAGTSSSSIMQKCGSDTSSSHPAVASRTSLVTSQAWERLSPSLRSRQGLFPEDVLSFLSFQRAQGWQGPLETFSLVLQGGELGVGCSGPHQDAF